MPIVIIARHTAASFNVALLETAHYAFTWYTEVHCRLFGTQYFEAFLLSRGASMGIRLHKWHHV